MAIRIRFAAALILCVTWQASLLAVGAEGDERTLDWLSSLEASAPLDAGLPVTFCNHGDASADESCEAPTAAAEAGRCWTVRADAVFLQRQTPSARALVTDSFFSGGNVLLDASEFKFQMAAGFALDVIRHDVRGTGWDLEGVFLDVDSFSAGRETIHSPGGGVSQFQVPLGNTFFAADISGTYHSQLRSVELNARRQWNDWLTVLGGFRYIDLREQGLQVIQDILATPSNRAIIDLHATNCLAGVQTGFEALVLQRSRFEISTLLKTGIFDNEASNSTLISQQSGSPFSSAANTSHVAFVSDLQVTATYHVTPALSARGGYQALWVSGVATAPNQMAVSNPYFGTATVDASSTVFYHGLFLGLEYNR